MSIEKITHSVNTLTELHHKIRDVVQSKTTIVKEGEMTALSPVLAKEQMLIQQVEKEENLRAAYVEEWFVRRNIHADIDRTMTHMLEHLEGDERAQLEQDTAELLDVIKDIKEQEHINHGLIQQSLQFVHMSLHMLQPSIEQMNYGKNNEHQQRGNRSMFDSKA